MGNSFRDWIIWINDCSLATQLHPINPLDATMLGACIFSISTLCKSAKLGPWMVSAVCSPLISEIWMVTFCPHCFNLPFSPKHPFSSVTLLIIPNAPHLLKGVLTPFRQMTLLPITECFEVNEIRILGRLSSPPSSLNTIISPKQKAKSAGRENWITHTGWER